MLIAIGISAVIVGAVMMMLKSNFDVQKHLSILGERSEIGMLIGYTIDCRRTFGDAGIDPLNPGTACNSTPSNIDVNRLIELRNKSGTPVVAAGGTLNGWQIRAACSASARSLVVQAAKIGALGAVIDPVERLPLDWAHPKRILFGLSNAASSLLCQRSFERVVDGNLAAGAGTAPCLAGQTLTRFDMTAAGPTPSCAQYVPTGTACAPGQVLASISAAGLPICRDVFAGIGTVCPAGAFVRDRDAAGNIGCDGAIVKDVTAVGYGAHVWWTTPSCPGGWTLVGGLADCGISNRSLPWDVDIQYNTLGAASARNLLAECSGTIAICIER